MRRRIAINSVLAGFLWTACSVPPESREPMEKQYFDLSALMHDQVVLLSILNPRFKKRIELDGKAETLEGRLDSSQWATELQVLAELDINLPRLKDSYSVSESYLQGDIKVISYQLNEHQESGIQYLRVFKDAVLDELLRIEVRKRVGNFLYDSESLIEMTFDTDDIGETFLRTYRIDGQQSILFLEATRFEIDGDIEY